jgi:hypothetical protein
MDNPAVQRKDRLALRAGGRSVRLEPVAGGAAFLVLPDLLLALRAAAETGLANLLLARSRLHDRILPGEKDRMVSVLNRHGANRPDRAFYMI